MEDQPHGTRRKQSHFRPLHSFSLRTLLIVTSVIAACLGWWTYTGRRQREAVAVITLGKPVGWVDVDGMERSYFFPLADVEYDNSLPWTSRQPNSPRWPQWLLDHVGVDYFARVRCVSVIDKNGHGSYGFGNLAPYSPLSDADLEHVGKLTSLLELRLDGAQITDAGLEQLHGLSNLKKVSLRFTGVTDAGMARLKQALPSCTIQR